MSAARLANVPAGDLRHGDRITTDDGTYTVDLVLEKMDGSVEVTATNGLDRWLFEPGTIVTRYRAKPGDAT